MSSCWFFVLLSWVRAWFHGVFGRSLFRNCSVNKSIVTGAVAEKPVLDHADGNNGRCRRLWLSGRAVKLRKNGSIQTTLNLIHSGKNMLSSKYWLMFTFLTIHPVGNLWDKKGGGTPDFQISVP
jgi:hypothetical protein